METRLKNGKNRGFLRSSDVWDSYDQCEHCIPDKVGDFYDVIGRIRSISTLKVHPRWSLTLAIFTMSVNMKFACLGHWGGLILSLLATKA